jgi:hypothetical protein
MGNELARPSRLPMLKNERGLLRYLFLASMLESSDQIEKAVDRRK